MDLQERWEIVHTGGLDPTREDRCVIYYLPKHRLSYNLFRTAMGNPDPAKVGAFGVGESFDCSGSNSPLNILRQVFTVCFQ